MVYPNDRLFAQTSAGKIGMWLFLLSDAFSFGGLLLGYGILRGSAEYWGCFKEQVSQFACTLEPGFSIPFTLFLTSMLIVSSITMVISHSALEAGDKSGSLKWLAATIAIGALFLLGQMQEYFGVLSGMWHALDWSHPDGLVKDGLARGAHITDHRAQGADRLVHMHLQFSKGASVIAPHLCR